MKGIQGKNKWYGKHETGHMKHIKMKQTYGALTEGYADKSRSRWNQVKPVASVYGCNDIKGATVRIDSGRYSKSLFGFGVG